MSGLTKAKKYDWKDSNMALFGSDTEKQVKKESAQTEAAWEGAGEEVGLQIWRVVKFKIEHWPKDEYGSFYSGDSYIILNTYKDEDSEELLYDVHFWIGTRSTQDEYATAAYKTVELDTFLDDKPIQHREVMNHESTVFKSYFDSVTIMKGGADTGFKRVLPEEYPTRLLRFKKEDRRVTVKELATKRSSLNSGDVFILDKGRTIFQWNGASCSKDEKFMAMQHCQELESKRNGRAKAEVVEEEATSDEHEFYKSLTGGVGNDDDDDDDDDSVDLSTRPKKMFRLTDASGKTEFEDIDEFSKDNLDSNDAFIIDAGDNIIVWVGAEASIDERHNALGYAHKYLNNTECPWLPVSVYGESHPKISASLDHAFK